jgi:anti-anti-sigma factor
MEILEVKQGALVILEIWGRLDASTSPDLERSFLSLLDRGERNVLIDFERLQYISSAGLRVLLLAAKRTAEAGGRLSLCAMGNDIREVFEIAGFTSIFQIHPTRLDAVGRT